MKNIIKKLTKKTLIQLKKIFTQNAKMKLLVGYLIANLIYILVGSYIFMTGKITDQFHYKEFSLGLKKLLEYNVIVFIVILFEKKYRKNWAHLGIFCIALFRSYLNILCF